MKQSSFRKSILCQQNVCFTRPAVQKCKDIQVTSQTLQVKTWNLEVFCIFAWKDNHRLSEELAIIFFPIHYSTTTFCLCAHKAMKQPTWVQDRDTQN